MESRYMEMKTMRVVSDNVPSGEGGRLAERGQKG